MSEFYDSYETRAPDLREADLLASLRGLLAAARTSAPALAAQIADCDIAALTSRAALSHIPVLRKSDLSERQKTAPPFGGLVATPPAKLKRLFASPGPIFEPEGFQADWWGAARALYAAGIRAGDILLNCFSYHLTPAGHMMESGAHALGCPVIPGGVGNTEQQVEAIESLRPVAYAGTPDFLKILLDRGKDLGRDMSCIRRGLVSGAALPGSLRAELKDRGVVVRQSYGTADLGLVAYESEALEGLIVNEGVIVEIVRPGTGDPVASGEVGEVVVTRLNTDYPLLRFGTGDLSAQLPGVSPCGRTNMRIKGWMGRADQTTKVKGMFVHPSQIQEVAKRHPELLRLRLIVGRADEQDVMRLRAESRTIDADLARAVVATLQAVTKLKGDVELVEQGTLPNDGKVIADERPIG
jgi:phenylacetate-CoA ligase